ncbi:MAG: hypothetical protein J0L82_01705 [Deltaproteobacteria bacterium]|jgi:hypothetical protein|nr:hypothetical protein [Deltaproteobacteria bacterium]
MNLTGHLPPAPDREEMPVFDESIFYPERRLYELGFTDEDIEVLVDCFRWHLNQRNLRAENPRLVSLLKLRAEQLIVRRKFELTRDIEALKLFSKS